MSCRLPVLFLGCVFLKSYLEHDHFLLKKKKKRDHEPQYQYLEIWLMPFHQDLQARVAERMFSPSFWCEDLEQTRYMSSFPNLRVVAVELLRNCQI